MINKNVLRSKWLAWCVIGSVSLFFFPGEALAQAKSGALKGYIYAEDMVTPVPGAVVKLRNVKDGREFLSAPTDRTGMYALKIIPEGLYEIGVSSNAGDFNFDFQLRIKADETAKLALALKPGGVIMQDAGKKKKMGFFISPLGVAAIVGASGLLVYAGIKIFEDKEDKSPDRN